MTSGKSNAIHEAFAELTKAQLTRLRRMADYPIRSNLSKADLVDALEDSFRRDPVKLLLQLPLYDLEYLNHMCGMDRDQCLVCEEFPDLLYIQEFNLCEWTYSKGGSSQEMWLTDDMYMLISPFIGQIVHDVTESGRCVIDFFFWGMIWLYGYLPTVEFINALKREFGSREEGWMPMYGQLVKYFPFQDCCNGSRFVVHPAIGEVEYMMGERQARGFDRKPLREYSFEQIMKVGAAGPYFRFGEDGKEYREAVKALGKCGLDDDEAAARLSRVWISVQDIDGPCRPTEILKMAIGHEPDFGSVRDLEYVSGAVFTYMNNIPRWCLGGRVPTEVSVSREHEDRLTAVTAAMDRVADMIANTPRVGRNDPCPCGSGLKYKNCHGKNFS